MTLLQSPLKPMRPLQRSSNLSVLSIAVPSAPLWLPSDPPWWSPALPAPWWSSDQDGAAHGSHGAWLSSCFSFFFLSCFFVCQTQSVTPGMNCWTFGRVHHKISFRFSNYSDVLLNIVVSGAAALFRCFRMHRRGKRAGALVKLKQGSRLTFCTGCTGAPNFFS